MGGEGLGGEGLGEGLGGEGLGEGLGVEGLGGGLGGEGLFEVTATNWGATGPRVELKQMLTLHKQGCARNRVCKTNATQHYWSKLVQRGCQQEGSPN